MARSERPRRSSRRTLLWVALGNSLALAAILGLFYAENHAGSDVTGQFAAQDARLGTWKFSPNYCSSGKALGFFGVELMHRRKSHWGWYRTGSERQRPRLRLVRDATRGTLVSVVLPGHADPIAVDLSTCTTRKIDVHRATSAPNGRLMTGSVELDCPALRGSASFENCY